MRRTRRPVSVIGSYARRAPEIDRVILAGFVLGGRRGLAVSARSPGCADNRQPGDPGRGGPGSPPDKALMGVVLSRKTGAGALKHPVLVVLGLRPDGRKEIVDYRLAKAESAAEWERTTFTLAA